MIRARLAPLERAPAGSPPGEFGMILATQGEASDGHILSIEGGQVPVQMPLLISHYADPTMQLGSVLHPRKLKDTRPARLEALGRIHLEGEGAEADRRRDVWGLIDAGHVNAVSIRWEPIKWVRRTELPAGHAAKVTDGDPDSTKRYGVYFSEWRALEGSVVSVGADPKAKIPKRSADEARRSLADEIALALDAGVPLEELAELIGQPGLAPAAMVRHRVDIPATEKPPGSVVAVPAPDLVSILRAELGRIPNDVARLIRESLARYTGRA